LMAVANLGDWLKCQVPSSSWAEQERSDVAETRDPCRDLRALLRYKSDNFAVETTRSVRE